MEMDNRPPSSPARCLHPRPASNPQSVVARAAAGSRVKRAYLAHHVILQLVAFLFIHYSHTTYQVIAGLCTIRFLSAVRAVAARCKHPFALRPGLSPEDVTRTKEITTASVEGKSNIQMKRAQPSPPPMPFPRTP